MPEFETIKDVVKEDLREEQAYNEMIAAVEEAKNAAKELSFDQIAREFGLSVHHTGMIDPSDDKKIQDLDKKGLIGKTLLGLDKVGALSVQNSDRACFLIKVDAIQDYTQEDFIDAQDKAQSSVATNRMNMQIESVVASLHRNATIETNESILIAGEEYSE